MSAPGRTGRVRSRRPVAGAAPREATGNGGPPVRSLPVPVPLDPRMASDIEASLRARLETLRASLRTGVVARREGAVRAIEEGAQAAETLENEVQVAVLHQRSEQVAQIEGALLRLAQGEYGCCRRCQEFIGLARLKALPFAQRCATCQARQEREAAA